MRYKQLQGFCFPTKHIGLSLFEAPLQPSGVTAVMWWAVINWGFMKNQNQCFGFEKFYYW